MAKHWSDEQDSPQPQPLSAILLPATGRELSRKTLPGMPEAGNNEVDGGFRNTAFVVPQFAFHQLQSLPCDHRKIGAEARNPSSRRIP